MKNYIAEGVFDSENLWAKSINFKNTLRIIENKYPEVFRNNSIANYAITTIDFFNGKIKLQEFSENLQNETKAEILSAFETIWQKV